MGGGDTTRKQLGRQAGWLEESLQWLVRSRFAECPDGKPSALDVGCGPGFVIDSLSDLLSLTGVDKDTDMVHSCRARDLAVTRGSAYRLPFRDSTFDLVYCTFLLMWLSRPRDALNEMKRVSRGYLACFAEPDYGARIDHPPALEGIRDALVAGLRQEGADPLAGRKLRGLMRSAGLNAEIGVHPGVWSTERLRREFGDEWAFVKENSQLGEDELGRVRDSWRQSLEEGTLFQYNPVFYAIARVRHIDECLSAQM